MELGSFPEVGVCLQTSFFAKAVWHLCVGVGGRAWRKRERKVLSSFLSTPLTSSLSTASLKTEWSFSPLPNRPLPCSSLDPFFRSASPSKGVAVGTGTQASGSQLRVHLAACAPQSCYVSGGSDKGMGSGRIN